MTRKACELRGTKNLRAAAGVAMFLGRRDKVSHEARVEFCWRHRAAGRGRLVMDVLASDKWRK